MNLLKRMHPCQLEPHLIFSTEQFDWDKVERRFVAEASDLGFRAQDNPYQQIYADACDVGVYLRSAKTDNVELFLLQGTENGEDLYSIGSWIYLSTTLSPPVTLVILND